MARPKTSPDGAGLQAFVLWPEHVHALQEWMDAYQCNRSQALRMMIDAAGPASSRRAVLAARKNRDEDERFRQHAASLVPADQLQAERRARRAETARLRRARKKLAPQA